MSEQMTDCPFCKAPLNQTGLVCDDDCRFVDCSICGKFLVSKFANLSIEHFDEAKLPRYIISSIIRNVWETTCQYFKIKPDMLESRAAILTASPIPVPDSTDVVRKSELLLKHIDRRSAHPGYVVNIRPLTDYPLAFCLNQKELRFCLDYLVKQNYLENIKIHNEITWDYRITPEGWIYLSGVGADKPDQAFVAMSFKDELTSLWNDGIKAGVAVAGYAPLRIDGKEHNNRIDDEIIAEIRKSRFIVADLTGNNAGAHFEAGFAMGLGKPVIWTCREKEVKAKKVHFDTRQYSIVTWADGNIPDFARRLALRVEATLGHGPRKTV